MASGGGEWCRSRCFSPVSQDAFGQMAGEGSLFSNLLGQGVTLRKRLAHQRAAEAARSSFGLAIPHRPDILRENPVGARGEVAAR
jgi:hypothetical protein